MRRFVRCVLGSLFFAGAISNLVMLAGIAGLVNSNEYNPEMNSALIFLFAGGVAAAVASAICGVRSIVKKEDILVEVEDVELLTEKKESV